MDLKEARLTKYPAITQNRLAYLTGLNQCTISAIENGDKVPTPLQKKLIAAVLECKVDDIF